MPPETAATAGPAARALAFLLVAGALVLALAGLLHPELEGGPAEHLATIAAAPGWRAIHLAMLAGSGLVIAGLWSQSLRAEDAPPRDASLAALLRAALVVLSVGYLLNALNIGYMAGAGDRMARLYVEGREEMAALYDATHPIGLVAARFGNFLVAIGAMLLGWAGWRWRVDPPWVSLLAWLAGVAGMGGVLLAHESTPYVLAPTALLTGWLVVAGVRTAVSTAPSA